MKKRSIILFYILILILIAIFLFSITHFGFYIFKKNSDLTLAKNRKSYIILEDTNLSNFINNNNKTLVIFWATWCSYCVDESNDLNEYIASNPSNSVVIVSHDNNKDDLKNYLEKNGYNWFVLFDNEKKIRESLDPGSTGIPSSYLLDKNGKIINFHKGKLTTKKFTNFFNEIKL